MEWKKNKSYAAFNVIIINSLNLNIFIHSVQRNNTQ